MVTSAEALGKPNLKGQIRRIVGLAPVPKPKPARPPSFASGRAAPREAAAAVSGVVEGVGLLPAPSFAGASRDAAAPASRAEPAHAQPPPPSFATAPTNPAPPHVPPAHQPAQNVGPVAASVSAPDSGFIPSFATAAAALDPAPAPAPVSAAGSDTPPVEVSPPPPFAAVFTYLD